MVGQTALLMPAPLPCPPPQHHGNHADELVSEFLGQPPAPAVPQSFHMGSLLESLQTAEQPTALHHPPAASAVAHQGRGAGRPLTLTTSN